MRCAQNSIQAALNANLKALRPKSREACRKRMAYLGLVRDRKAYPVTEQRRELPQTFHDSEQGPNIEYASDLDLMRSSESSSIVEGIGNIAQHTTELQTYANVWWPSDDKFTATDLGELLESQSEYLDADFEILFGQSNYESFDPNSNGDSFDFLAQGPITKVSPPNQGHALAQPSCLLNCSPIAIPSVHPTPNFDKLMARLGCTGSPAIDVNILISLCTPTPNKGSVSDNKHVPGEWHTHMKREGHSNSHNRRNALHEVPTDGHFINQSRMVFQRFVTEMHSFWTTLLGTYYKDIESFGLIPWSHFSHIVSSAPIPKAVLMRTDCLGNSVMHFLSFRNAPISLLITFVAQGAPINKYNTIGQTFLHCLTAQRLDSEFNSLIAELASRSFNFNQVDVHGSNILHRISSMTGLSNLNPQAESLSVLLRLTPQLLERYNSIGVLAKMQIIHRPPQHHSDHSSELDPGESSELLSTIKAAATGKVTRSDCPNGLHCLFKSIHSEQIFDTRFGVKMEQARPCSIACSLIDAGVDMNAYNADGYTSLLYGLSIAKHSPGYIRPVIEAVAMLLIERGANIHLRCRSHETALHFAVQAGLIDCTALLIKNGANPNARVLKSGVVDYHASSNCSLCLDPSDPRRIRTIACVNLVVDAGGIANPAFLDEWSVDRRHNLKRDSGDEQRLQRQHSQTKKSRKSASTQESLLLECESEPLKPALAI